jgi:hypothetical protein
VKAIGAETLSCGNTGWDEGILVPHLVEIKYELIGCRLLE